jgi:hypothetical protein
MPFYRFHLCDPINRIDGHGHDGAALADDIDAMIFAAGIAQRLIQDHPGVPRNWAVNILRGESHVGVLPLETGLQVLMRPQSACDHPVERDSAW